MYLPAILIGSLRGPTRPCEGAATEPPPLSPSCDFFPSSNFAGAIAFMPNLVYVSPTFESDRHAPCPRGKIREKEVSKLITTLRSAREPN